MKRIQLKKLIKQLISEQEREKLKTPERGIPNPPKDKPPMSKVPPKGRPNGGVSKIDDVPDPGWPPGPDPYDPDEYKGKWWWKGCTDPNAMNYNPEATTDEDCDHPNSTGGGCCQYIPGCRYEEACNYEEGLGDCSGNLAIIEDNGYAWYYDSDCCEWPNDCDNCDGDMSCHGCNDPSAINYNPNGANNSVNCEYYDFWENNDICHYCCGDYETITELGLEDHYPMTVVLATNGFYYCADSQGVIVDDAAECNVNSGYDQMPLPVSDSFCDSGSDNISIGSGTVSGYTICANIIGQTFYCSNGPPDNGCCSPYGCCS